jgi:hypothetical protein
MVGGLDPSYEIDPDELATGQTAMEVTATAPRRPRL